MSIALGPEVVTLLDNGICESIRKGVSKKSVTISAKNTKLTDDETPVAYENGLVALALSSARLLATARNPDKT